MASSTDKMKVGHTTTTQKNNSESKLAERTVDEIVADSWQVIDEQIRDRSKVNRERSINTEPGWKVVRLFVSSTFNDYFSEREVLVKKVFPELREWCTQRRLHLVECDLRWGVPKDSSTATTIYTCMEEIERCHGDTDHQGLFLNMLGQRYGWIPSRSDVPEDIAELYDWVYDISITHMEILLGGLRKQNDNALFMIRKDGQWIEKLDDAGMRQFYDHQDLGKYQLKELKKRLKGICPKQVYEYECEYDDVRTDRIRLTGLDDFAAYVLNYFKAAIERCYPETEDGPEETPEVIEQKNQDLFLEQKGNLVRGRVAEIKAILYYCKSPFSPEDLANHWPKSLSKREREKEEKSEEIQEDVKDLEKNFAAQSLETLKEQLEDGYSPIIAIAAEPGVGKSSLMAKCVQNALETKLEVFYHFIGCTASSTSHTNLMARLCQALAGDDEIKNQKLEAALKGEEKELIDLYQVLLQERTEAEDKGQMVVFIDDLSQLRRAEGNLAWLPSKGVPSKKVTFIVSMVKGDSVVDEVNECAPEAVLWLELGELNLQARVDIITNFFGRFNKTLHPKQMALLSQSQGSRNALWLSLACEEMRVFGTFERVSQLIMEFPSSLDGLLELILCRLVREDETSLVQKTLCCLQCAREGLREDVFPLLLSDQPIKDKEPVPMLHWAMVRRTLRPFLRVASSPQQLNVFRFFHQAIGKAAQKQWLADEKSQVMYHTRLADLFLMLCEEQSHLATEVAYHLNAAKLVDRLINFIKNDPKGRRVPKPVIARYLKDNKCKRMLNPKFDKSITQLFVCRFCENQRGAFAKNSMWSNKDACPLCGEFIIPTQRKRGFEAYWCQFHPRRGPFFGNKPMCHICKKPIQMGKPTTLYLCHWCHPTPGFSTCCRLNNE